MGKNQVRGYAAPVELTYLLDLLRPQSVQVAVDFLNCGFSVMTCL